MVKFDFLSLGETDGEGGIDGGARGGSAEVKSVGRAVNIVEYVVNACLQSIAGMTAVAEGVGGGESPDLECFAVAVNLIVALGGEPSVESES